MRDHSSLQRKIVFENVLARLVVPPVV